MKSRKTLLAVFSQPASLSVALWSDVEIQDYVDGVSSEPFQVEQSFSYLEIQGIQSNKPTQVQTTLLSFSFITSQHTWQHLDYMHMCLM